MKILILGGTRFLGKKILDLLLISDNNIFIISRKNIKTEKKFKLINKEREDGINSFKGETFDLTIDFIGYRKEDIIDLYSKINIKKYIFISSTWITRLWGGSIANEFKLINKNKDKLTNLTKKYLIGKYECEEIILELINNGFNAKIIRLPIIFGEGDHTGRLNFYMERILDNKPIILIKNYNRKIQIGCIENISFAFIEWLKICENYPINIWEGLPNDGIKISSFIRSLAKSIDINIKFIAISKESLMEYLPEYLDLEPFWREKVLKVSNSNIYRFIKIKPNSFNNCSFTNKIFKQTELRKKEINYFAKYLSN